MDCREEWAVHSPVPPRRSGDVPDGRWAIGVWRNGQFSQRVVSVVQVLQRVVSVVQLYHILQPISPNEGKGVTQGVCHVPPALCETVDC